MNLKITGFVCVLALVYASIFPYSAKVLKYTLDGTTGAASVEPAFSFNSIWTGLGMGKNQHVYVAVCDQKETGGYGPIGKGDVCVVEYNPYTNTMKSCGTVKKACLAVNNWMANESQEKIHTHLQSTSDGKIWMGTHDNEGADKPGDPDYYPGIFYRGAHLMYVDVFNGDTLVDQSQNMQYYYKKDDAVPTLMSKGIPASDTSGVVFQYHSIIILGVNPYNTRYLWMESTPGALNYPRTVVWDRIEDTLRAVGAGDGSMREMMVDKLGRAYHVAGGNAVRKSPNGTLKFMGGGLTSGSSMTYSRSFDSAFTINALTGEVNLYDFIHDTVKQIADMPDGNAMAYRCLVTSADGHKLYCIGAGASIYEITIATGAYASIYNFSSTVSGYSYATGNMCVDTLGNLYAGVHNGQINGAGLLQINLGKALIRPLDIPDAPSPAERNAEVATGDELLISPNPFNPAAVITVDCGRLKGVVRVSVYDASGSRTADLFSGKQVSGKKLMLRWDASGLPSGVYLIRLQAGGQSVVKKALLAR